MPSATNSFTWKLEHLVPPSKEKYEAYVHPINPKTGERKEVREMTIKEAHYHNWMMSYWIKNIQPYQSECD